MTDVERMVYRMFFAVIVSGLICTLKSKKPKKNLKTLKPKRPKNLKSFLKT